MSDKIDLTKPRYDQSTYFGRAAHFLRLTNPLNCLVTEAQLDEAKQVVDQYKKTKRMPAGYDADKLWAAKYLYDSAHHPDTGERQLLIGRMSAQAPMNTMITGGMLIFYKSKAAMIFWQWLNQTFNAVVNFTNRAGDSPISPTQLVVSYIGATSGAVSIVLALNNYVKRNPKINPIFARLVPFAAVCGANFINIPLMRSSELMSGSPVFAKNGIRVGESKTAAVQGIGLVCISRVLMALPGMALTPVVTAYGIQHRWFCRAPFLAIPFQLAFLGMCVTFATPMCCALFNQTSSIPISWLDKDLKTKMQKEYPNEDHVLFNKGL